MEDGLDVIVVGGGFAGIAAACRLAGDGHHPLLLERAPRLGGRASAFFSPERNESIDYGHHVLMRCCTAATGFLLRVGMVNAVRFQPTLSIPIAWPTGRSVLRSFPLPGILHLAPALLGYRALSFSDRLRVIRAGLTLSLPRAPGDVPFSEWLVRHSQSDQAIARLWNPICIATLNAPANAVSAQVARRVFRDALFRPDGADMGFFTISISDVFGAASRYIEERGGTVRKSSPVKRLLIESGRVRGVELETGETIDCDAAVCAIPPTGLPHLAGEAESLVDVVEKANRLRWSPIVNLHAWFDRSVLEDEFVVAVDSPVQAVFDVTRLQERTEDEGTTHVVLSQSAAAEWIDRPFADVTGLLLDALGKLFPRVLEARCVHTLVVRHRNATFVPAPGSDQLRPPATTPIRGLYLAGDWTSTGWPSTIEGAIRSGIVAAAHAETWLIRLSETEREADADDAVSRHPHGTSPPAQEAEAL
jgi:squalene-associated FAD-dependent desaturase